MAIGDSRRNSDLGNDLSAIAAALGDIADRMDRDDRPSYRARSSAPDRTTLDRIAAMLDDVGRELDDADHGLGRRPPPPRRPSSQSAQVAELAATLQSLERHVADLTAAPSRGQAAPRRAGELTDIRQRLDALRRPDPAPADPRQADSRRLAAIEQRLSETVARMADAGRTPRPLGAAPSRPSPDLDAAIAEISARQLELAGRDSAAGQPRPRRAEAALEAEQLAQITSRLDQLSQKLDAAQHAQATRTARVADADLNRLADRIAALTGPRPDDTAELQHLRADLDAMRQHVAQSARETTLRSIEAGYGHIVERLDDMVRRVPDQARLDQMTAEIVELRRELAASQSDAQIDQLEHRLHELGEELRATASAGAADVSSWFGQIESRLVEIGRVLSGLETPAPSSDTKVLERLETQLGALSRRFDELAASRAEPGPNVETVMAEIANLRSELADYNRYEIGRLEQQITELSDRLAGMAPGAEDHDALRQLEAEVKLLAAKLDNGGDKPAAFAKIEVDLAELQAMLADSRRETIEAARDAALAAVGDYTGGADSDTLQRFKSELGELQSTAAESDRRTQDALEAVHDTLKRVVDRMSDLERDPDERDDEPVALRPTGTEGAPAQSEDATAQSGGWWTSAAPAGGDDRPLEPGSGKPAVTEARSEERSAAERKADFIAAARRAAQAAAADGVSGNADDDDEPGPIERISKALLSRKRTTMLAAAVAIVAALAIQFHQPAIGFMTDLAGSVRQQFASAPTLPDDGTMLSMDGPVDAAGTGSMLPDNLRQPAPKASAAFAPPSGVENRFAATANAPSASGFSAGPGADAVDGGRVDPRATASITPASDPIETIIAADPEPTEPVAEGAPAEDATDAAMPPPVAALPEAAMPEPGIGSEKLRAAAAAGDPAAQYEIGERYAEGRGVARDSAEAALWFERAATRGLAPAQYRLASLYERGLGVGRDRTLAHLWYGKAAAAGNARAMHNLAVVLSEGVSGEPDFRQAIEWFRQAAEYDVRDSQYNLGVIYARGLGVEQDLVQSYKWFALAGRSGDTDSTARRDEVAAVLSPEQLDAGKEIVAAWEPVPLIAKANTVAAPPGGWDDAPEPAAGPAAEAESLIEQAQALLARRGFDPGPADGVDGPRTRDAVMAFQKLTGQAVDGVIDADLVEALQRDSI